ncbi:MAG: DUF2878 domain-containing protein [Methylophilaceae bacterium]
MTQVIKNIAAFQVGWFACVLGGAHGLPWLGLVIAALVLTLHLFHAHQPRQELYLLIWVFLLGVLFDSVLLNLGWIVFPHDGLGILPPLWMLTLWLLFATTLNVSLRWMRGRAWLAALFGLIGGPMAYWGGSGLGALQLAAPLPMTIALALGWAVLMPLFFKLSTRYDGFAK